MENYVAYESYAEEVAVPVSQLAEYEAELADKKDWSVSELREVRDILLHNLHYAVGIYVGDKNHPPYLIVFENVIPTTFMGLEVKVIKSSRVIHEKGHVDV